MYSFPGLNVFGIGGVLYFLQGYIQRSVYLSACGSECDLLQNVDPAGILNLGDLCMLWSNSITG